MKRSSTPWSRLSSSLSLGLFALLTLTLSVGLGCVSRGAYDEAVDSRDRLAGEKKTLTARVVHLESSNQSLEDGRVQLMEKLEDVSEIRNRLEQDTRQQQQSIAGLQGKVSVQSSEIVNQQAALDARNSEVAELRGTFESLVSDLESEVASGQIEIEQLREGVRLSVSDDILFSSGSANLNADGQAVLETVARELAQNQYAIEVHGHTDNLAMRGGKGSLYPSNWELAGARAARVVRLFVTSGVSGERLSAVSRAEYFPRADNTSEEGRSSNRRIEIRLLPPTP
jgi:chemotaxis protein MotB